MCELRICEHIQEEQLRAAKRNTIEEVSIYSMESVLAETKAQQQQVAAYGAAISESAAAGPSGIAGAYGAALGAAGGLASGGQLGINLAAVAAGLGQCDGLLPGELNGAGKKTKKKKSSKKSNKDEKKTSPKTSRVSFPTLLVSILLL